MDERNISAFAEPNSAHQPVRDSREGGATNGAAECYAGRF